MSKRTSKEKLYRVWLEVQEDNRQNAYQGEVVERVEVAAFHTLEEALTYRYELSQKCSPGATRESEVAQEMTDPGFSNAGD